MLARTPITDTYLTAAELGITEKEREALIWVRGKLDSGRLRHVHYRDKGSGFNMNACGLGCNTPACIGGSMALRMKLFFQFNYVYTLHSASLHSLFFPNKTHSIGDASMNDLTPAQAVRAIDALDQNPGLGDFGPILPLGTEVSVIVPAPAPKTPVRKLIRLTGG